MLALDATIPIQVVQPESAEQFVETDFVRALVRRGETYLKAGCHLHLRGRSGTGKTALGLHLARSLGRPVIVIHGDEEHTTSGLVGGERGYRIRRVSDNFIRSVRKMEEDVSQKWTDNRLTTACRFGFTLFYDEFNRSRPEANNVLLSVLQGGVLSLPLADDSGEHYVRVHPQFRAIFTSNPEEYAGVHATQDALRTRMITIDVDLPDRETEVAIAAMRSDLDPEDCARIVDVVREARRKAGGACSHCNVRSSVTLARVLAAAGTVTLDAAVRDVFLDVLVSGGSRTGDPKELERMRATLGSILDRHGMGRDG